MQPDFLRRRRVPGGNRRELQHVSQRLRALQSEVRRRRVQWHGNMPELPQRLRCMHPKWEEYSCGSIATAAAPSSSSCGTDDHFHETRDKEIPEHEQRPEYLPIRTTGSERSGWHGRIRMGSYKKPACGYLDRHPRRVPLAGRILHGTFGGTRSGEKIISGRVC